MTILATTPEVIKQAAAELKADPARLEEIMPGLSALWSRASAALESWAAQRSGAG